MIGTRRIAAGHLLKVQTHSSSDKLIRSKTGYTDSKLRSMTCRRRCGCRKDSSLSWMSFEIRSATSRSSLQFGGSLRRPRPRAQLGPWSRQKYWDLTGQFSARGSAWTSWMSTRSPQPWMLWRPCNAVTWNALEVCAWPIPDLLMPMSSSTGAIGIKQPRGFFTGRPTGRGWLRLHPLTQEGGGPSWSASTISVATSSLRVASMMSRTRRQCWNGSSASPQRTFCYSPKKRGIQGKFLPRQT
mmetsp:Transcript_9718/g.21739  ORF Transcript_9718/g.21739 Transcript_9718/m.21739 type:complete len:242 (+) Transcript_9718:908-1633(+)